VSGLARGLPSLVQLSLPANSLTGALPAVSPRLLLLDLSSNPALSSTLADLAPPNTNELAHLVLADAGLTGPVREDDLLPLGGLVRLRLEDNELEVRGGEEASAQRRSEAQPLRNSSSRVKEKRSPTSKNSSSRVKEKRSPTSNHTLPRSLRSSRS
jgi:hypothetical protein